MSELPDVLSSMAGLNQALLELSRAERVDWETDLDMLVRMARDRGGNRALALWLERVKHAVLAIAYEHGDAYLCQACGQLHLYKSEEDKAWRKGHQA
jgi:hypothetical protein